MSPSAFLMYYNLFASRSFIAIQLRNVLSIAYSGLIIFIIVSYRKFVLIVWSTDETDDSNEDQGKQKEIRDIQTILTLQRLSSLPEYNTFPVSSAKVTALTSALEKQWKVNDHKNDFPSTTRTRDKYRFTSICQSSPMTLNHIMNL
jgi:predicted signal transduction protein with EAL and GGDEF domain